MIQQTKLQNNSMEIDAINQTRPTQALKTKKPQQILTEVRTRKIQELNQYKDAPAEKKFKDIQSLLSMMNAYGKLPKAKNNPDGSDS